MATLDYSNPDELFAASYRFRGQHGMTTAFWLIAVSAALALPAAWPSLLRASGELRWALGVIAAVLFGLAAYMVHGWATDRELRLTITSEGVRYGNMRWPWRSIASVGGQCLRGEDDIYLFFELRSGGTRGGMIDPMLDRAGYQEVVALLKREVGARWPHVTFEDDPRPPTNN